MLKQCEGKMEKQKWKGSGNRLDKMLNPNDRSAYSIVIKNRKNGSKTNFNWSKHSKKPNKLKDYLRYYQTFWCQTQ